jgi:hypothetical protein
LRRHRQLKAREAPDPVTSNAAKARADGVVEDVLDGLLPVIVVANQPAAEPLLEEVALPLPACVEALRVEAGKAVHPR